MCFGAILTVLSMSQPVKASICPEFITIYVHGTTTKVGLKLLSKFCKDVTFGKSGVHHFNQLPEINDQVINSENKILIKIKAENERFLLLMPITELKEELTTGNNIWQLKNIQVGIAEIDLQNTNEFTAHDLNLPELNAVSFTKGCYTGQEIVARMHYLGKLKQHLQMIEFTATEIPLPKTKLCDQEGRTVGRLVTIAKTMENHYVALALLQDSALENIIALENTVNPVKVNKR